MLRLVVFSLHQSVSLPKTHIEPGPPILPVPRCLPFPRCLLFLYACPFLPRACMPQRTRLLNIVHGGNTASTSCPSSDTENQMSLMSAMAIAAPWVGLVVVATFDHATYAGGDMMMGETPCMKMMVGSRGCVPGICSLYFA